MSHTFLYYYSQTEFEESFKRRRTSLVQSAINAPVNIAPASQQAPIGLPAGQYTATALAAAVAAINASVAATSKPDNSSGRGGGGEEKRKTKWG